MLTVAAIPVAMPTVLSVTMAVGARLLAKKQAIVSRLVAIEELAGVDVLCADKTGTLTQNKLTLGEPFGVDGIPAGQVILHGALASRAENNDTIDLAVLGGLKDKEALKAYEVIHFQPFDPVHKRTEAAVRAKDGTTFKATKGAPQVILKLAANAGQVTPAVDKAVNEFAARGFRSLGVARAEGDGPWQFLGVLPLFDPPREDAKTTIATARAMGVKIKMVTGDALAIAKETAKKLDMGATILDAASLGDTKKQESTEVAESIENADGFAQVFPEHKFHIVDVLKQRGHIVGMTGDGVNDAPALKKADCGIAVSGATDAARAAAAIVLMSPGLAVIIDAIEESRRIFQRMNSYAIYRIAETLRVLFFMTLAILIFNFYPLTAVMIVMLALLNDGAILSIAYDHVHYKDKPEAWNMRMVLGISTALGVIGVVAAFGLFYLGERVFHLDRPHLQTLMYLKLSVAGHLTIFLARTRGPFWSIRPAKTLWMAVLGTQTVATLIAVYGLFMTPLGWGWAGFVWGYALLWFLVNDRVKLLAYRIFDPVKAVAKAGTESEVKAPTEPPSARTPDAVETQAGPEADAKPDAKPSPDTKDETTSDLTPQIAARAYELYEHQGHPDGQSVQNWDEAEREVRATKAEAEPKAETKPAAQGESQPEAEQPGPDARSKPNGSSGPPPASQIASKPHAEPESTPEPKPKAKTETAPGVEASATPDAEATAPSAAKAEPEPGAETAIEPSDQVEPKPDAQAGTKREPKAKPAIEVAPQLVSKVHEFYQQLGREDVRAVQEADEAAQKARVAETKE